MKKAKLHKHSKGSRFQASFNKGQTEIVSTTLFFLIAIILLFSVFVWGNSVIGGNSDEARLFASEQFMRNIDDKIQNIAKNGGIETLRMPSGGSIIIAEGGIIEYGLQGKADMPQEWLYIYGSESPEVGITEPPSVIREKKENDRIKIHLYYRNRTGSKKYLIFPIISHESSGQNMIKIESNGTQIIGDLVLNRVKLSV